MIRQLLFTTLLITATASLGCDADVLRLNYHKTPAAKPIANPGSRTGGATTVPKSTDAVRHHLAPTALLTASTKLEPR